jgi:peptidase inhibitor family I36
MRVKIQAALASVAAMIGLGIGVAAAPAQAAVTDCPVGNFCIWTLTNYSGTRYTINYSDIYAGSNHGYRLGTFASNRGRSFYNHTTASINIYDDGACGYSPWTRTMSSGQYATSQGSDWGDRVSSLQIARYAPNC